MESFSFSSAAYASNSDKGLILDAYVDHTELAVYVSTKLSGT